MNKEVLDRGSLEKSSVERVQQEVKYVHGFVKPLLFLLILIQMIEPAFGHVNWFVNEMGVSNGPILAFRFSEPEVQLAVFITAVMILIAALLDRLLTTTFRFRFVMFMSQSSMLRVSQVLVGISLFSASLKSAFFAPHFSGFEVIPWQALCLEALVGVLFIAGQWLRLSAILMLLLYVYLGSLFGAVSFLEYANFIGLALIYFVHSDDDIEEEAKAVAMWFFRMTVGIALITLGLSEKLLNPSLAMEFMLKYEHINFMQMIGLNFPDRLFIMSTGFAEVLFGCVFIFGYVTRINTLALAFFLIVSNSYFFMIGQNELAMMELFGHLPLFACAILFIVCGAGASVRDAYTFVANAHVDLVKRLGTSKVRT